MNVAQGTGSDLTLSWTNPTDADFAGVIIRRAVGPTAPASPTAGTLVTTTAEAATSFTDTGLAGDTQYSYALFAFDTAKNNAAAATRTATSGAVTTAALSLNGSTGATAKQTVGQSQAFDVSGHPRRQGPDPGLRHSGLRRRHHPEEFSGDPATWAPDPHQYDVDGTVTATLTVVDSASKTVSMPLHVTVFAPPTATITVDPASVLEKGQPSRSCHVGHTRPARRSPTSTASATPATTSSSGAGAPPATFTITFANPGTYTVTVEGFNDAGGSGDRRGRGRDHRRPPTPYHGRLSRPEIPSPTRCLGPNKENT